MSYSTSDQMVQLLHLVQFLNIQKQGRVAQSVGHLTH